jgi:hypothetical protein
MTVYLGFIGFLAYYKRILDQWIQVQRTGLDYPPWWIGQAEDCGVSADPQPHEAYLASRSSIPASA